MKKSQELKKQILQNLTDWCFDPLGDLVKARFLANRTYQNINHYWFRLYQDDETNPNWRTEPKIDDFILDPKDYQEVKEAMIKEITQNPQDWEIGREGELTIIRHKSGRKHWRSEFSKGFQKGFKEQEWKEIENALNGSSNPEIPSDPSKEQQAQQEQLPPEKLNYMDYTYYRDSKH